MKASTLVPCKTASSTTTSTPERLSDVIRVNIWQLMMGGRRAALSLTGSCLIRQRVMFGRSIKPCAQWAEMVTEATIGVCLSDAPVYLTIRTGMRAM